MKKNFMMLLITAFAAISVHSAPPPQGIAQSMTGKVTGLAYFIDWPNCQQYVQVNFKEDGGSTYLFAIPLATTDVKDVDRMYALLLSAKSTGSTVDMYYDSPVDGTAYGWNRGDGYRYGLVRVAQIRD